MTFGKLINKKNPEIVIPGELKTFVSEDAMKFQITDTNRVNLFLFSDWDFVADLPTAPGWYEAERYPLRRGHDPYELTWEGKFLESGRLEIPEKQMLQVGKLTKLGAEA